MRTLAPSWSNTQVGDIISRLIQFNDHYEKRTHRILEMYHVLKAEYGETTSQTLFAVMRDVNKAINVADLTEVQAECLRLYYFGGYTLEEIADLRDVKKQSVQQAVRTAIKKVADVLREWKYWN